jgi:hypothetical protein
MASESHQFLIAASELYSSALFGRQDPEAWLQRFLPIVATVTTYRRGASTPNSKKDRAKFWGAVNKISRQLSGQTVSQVIRIVDESLIRLFIIKHVISSIFKDHLDILTLLLKLRPALSTPPPVLGTSTMGTDVGRTNLPALSSHYIPPITMPPQAKYTTPDIQVFIKLRDQIKSSERLEDKKRLSSTDPDSPLVLAFVAPDTPLVSSPSSRKRRKMSSPGSILNVHSGAMEDFDDSDGEDSSPPNNAA